MIIVQLLGGLGNQMFQYAAGRSLAKSLGTHLKLDIFAYDPGLDRQFALDCFKMEYEIATKSEVRSLASSLKTRIFRRLHKDFGVSFRDEFTERGFKFDPRYRKVRNNTYITGYWQSPLYFEDYQDTVRSDFDFKPLKPGKAQDLMKDINNTSSVALHFRRGDYVANKKHAEFHGTCGIEYYQKAVNTINEDFPGATLYVFSDDIEWVKNNFRTSLETRYVSDLALEDWEEMKLMSSCKHQVIANSSFSWWAAWLNPFPEKKIIAPKTWFLDSSIDTTDLIPTSWIRI